MSNPTSASEGLSGRELARERRKAMSRNGKAAVKSNGQQGQNRGDGRPSRAGRAARDAETAAEPARSAPETQPSEAPVESAAQVSAPSRDDRPEQSIQPGLNAGASNGRQAALERRRKMARQGKKAVGHSKTRAQVLGGMARAGAEGSQQMEALAQSQGMAIDCSNMSGREICRLRRQALSQDGKKAMAAEPRREDKMKGIAATSSAAADSRSGDHGTATPEAADAVPGTPGAGDQEVVESGLDQLCERVESDDDRVAPHPMISEVRAICMARREAMAQNGKKAMHRRFRGDQARGTLPHEGAWKAAQRKGLSTREVARQRREERCKLGRGSSEPGRPCGRPRALEGEAPAKVQESTTLSGSPVLGTQVESESSVTGTEAGECSHVTGTEYLGQEYYDRYCRTSPDPNPPKVAYSHTARGSEVSGTEVGRSPKVTGDESGSCESVTGTEYLSTEQYEGFCATRPEPGPTRVSVMRTRQGEDVSGTSVGRSPKVTGDESGSCRSITGSEYLNEQASEVPCTGKPSGAPMKAGVMHTLRGRELTGTEVGRSVQVTGDEHGSCEPVTGTEYLGTEHFQGFCATRPDPAPAKVRESHTADDQSVTGTAVGRSERVTGDESGSCRSLTGTPYYNQADFDGLCAQPAGGGVPKVGVMHTLRGREVSGTRVESSIRVTGDEYGGCKPITGTEYVGSDHYDAFCGTQPEAGPEKVTVGRTWNQQNVSGTAVGRSARVTGDEYGACKPVSGTSYIGPDQYETFCETPDARAAETRVADHRATPGHPVSGSQPGYDDRVTGTERGSCQDVSGSPYVGADEFARSCSTAAASLHPRLRPEEGEGATGEPETAPSSSRPMPGEGFSVQTPARQARERRERLVTGTAYGSTGRITGSINKAAGLVSGTEEFRYEPHHNEPVVAEPEDASKIGAERVTVNGSSNGVTVTGDDWGRGNRVTGTEGFSTRRNATQKGNPRGEGRSAYSNREMERKDVPMSRITGSSGNSGSGSLVTLSGGARG